MSIVLGASLSFSCSDILDTPEFFWDHPELEAKYYSPAIASLDLKQRVAVLNKKLEVHIQPASSRALLAD
jgi:uncharacterized Rmd1/YagE family protein